jgi:hypothetical protein
MKMDADPGMHYRQALKVQPAIFTELPEGRLALMFAPSDEGKTTLSVITGLQVSAVTLADDAAIGQHLRQVGIPEEGWTPSAILAERWQVVTSQPAEETGLPANETMQAPSVAIQETRHKEVLLQAFDALPATLMGHVREAFMRILDADRALDDLFLIIISAWGRVDVSALANAYNVVWTAQCPAEPPIDFAAAAREARLIWEIQDLVGVEHVTVASLFSNSQVVDALNAIRERRRHS